MVNVHAFKSALNLINTVVGLLCIALFLGSLYLIYKAQYDVLIFTIPTLLFIVFIKSLVLGVGYCAAETAINSGEIAKNSRLILSELQEANKLNKTN
ncbi:hypothetical protein [Photobacterium leiognathi]|uniref:hypothetical protein n=1 Tax=Photobacterium leiognathi TaxID=553611 RepID=UPI002739B177|nr:hypothetical protein [Photobacterium leiognathi]